MARDKKAKAESTLAEKLWARKKEEAGRTSAGHDGELAKELPYLHELLTTVIRDEKKVLEPACVLVFVRTGSFHACLTHKGLDLKWWGEGGTLKAAFQALEANLTKESGQETDSMPDSNTARP